MLGPRRWIGSVVVGSIVRFEAEENLTGNGARQAGSEVDGILRSRML